MTASARPESEVSTATGLVGLAALAVSTIAVWAAGITPGIAVLLILPATAAPMILWSVLVDRVHRNASTGLDFSRPRAWPEVWEITRVKVIGLGATFAAMAVAYATFSNYADPSFNYYFLLLGYAGPALFAMGVPYIALTTRYMVQPKDGLWHFGKFVSFQPEAADMKEVKDHARAWAVKTFFLAFMVSILPGLAANVLRFDAAVVFDEPVAVILFTIQAMFFVDVAIGTIGYVMTLRVLDSHIRTANPLLAGWVAALACYPPFALSAADGPLNYREGTQEWMVWFAGNDLLIILWGAPILILTGIYAWATVVFGLRFSNLTHRGILTNGPFRFSKHPAYLSKNLSWWLISLPFLSAAGTLQGLENCLLLLGLNAIYFMRARTEEKHLMTDPRYQAYAAWIAEHGLFARARRALVRGLGGSVAPARQTGHAVE